MDAAAAAAAAEWLHTLLVLLPMLLSTPFYTHTTVGTTHTSVGVVLHTLCSQRVWALRRHLLLRTHIPCQYGLWWSAAKIKINMLSHALLMDP